MYPPFNQEELVMVDVKYKVKVEYWVANNYLQNYKIYVTLIHMFHLKFLDNLWQVLGDNP